MKIGVVSDTHNRYKHIEIICQLFIKAGVSAVIHTGDIASPKALGGFSTLSKAKIPLIGAWGNNDIPVDAMQSTANELDFQFHEGWQKFELYNRAIYLGHDPEEMDVNLLGNLSDTLVLHGHTHRYRLENMNSNIIFNPGECAGMMKNANAIGVVDLTDLSTARIFF